MARSQFNSMPQNQTSGINDKSIPDSILNPKVYPTHLPLWLIFAKKGPSTRVLADGATREQLFGTETFLASSKFFTHQTQFSNTVNGQANQGIYQRVFSPEAKKAMVRIWMDVLPTLIPEYTRGTDGKYLLNQAGQPTPTGTTVPGFKIKFVKTAISDVTGGAFGEASQMVGDQTDSTTLVQSTRFPLMDVPVAFVGGYGNDLGIRMWSPVAGSRITPDAELIEDNKAYPYIFSCQDRSSDTIQNLQTVSGVQEVTTVFKRDQVKASVGNQAISFEPRFFESWNDRERVGIAPLYGPFDNVHLYYENLEEQLTRFYNAEKALLPTQFSDFTGEGDEEIHRFNFLGGKSSKNVPYHSFVIERAAGNAEAVSDLSTIWAVGGDDGNLDLDTFDELCAAEIRKYGDINEEVTDNRLANPESHFYDSGFSVDTKIDLANFIAVRKDTFLVWCLQDAQQARPLLADEESSLAIALFTRGQMMPESVEWGTPAARAMIVAGDGRLISSDNRKRLPLSLEIASKSAQYMGAGNALWKSAFSFSHGPRAELSMFRDVNVSWRPIAARQRDWANGMVYVQKKDMDQLFFPALRTIYNVAESILTSYFTTLVFVDLQKVADRVWAEFSGSDEYSNEQFKKYVELLCRQLVEGRYDSRVALIFTVNFTKVDEFNGYSWTLNVDVGADVMKTVQYTILTGYRRESMPAAN